MEDKNKELIARFRQFMDDEAMNCSMDYGCCTPEYVFRMWGGEVPLEEIREAMREIKSDFPQRDAFNKENQMYTT